ncbi:hypothetical protein IMY05_C2141000200 [Salix suchowensis]|nr:hypothetical protein IMY05_C2141000200 [Salix suchowensis]
MGCPSHIGEAECASCEAYLSHIATCWGANEKGLRDIVKTNNDAPLLQARLSEMETKLLALAASSTTRTDLGDEIRHLTDERDGAMKSVTWLEAQLSILEKESRLAQEDRSRAQLLTEERDRAMVALNEQTEINRVWASEIEALGDRCKSLAEANRVLALKNKESSDAYKYVSRSLVSPILMSTLRSQINKDLLDERSPNADLKETIRLMTDGDHDDDSAVEESGGMHLDTLPNFNDHQGHANVRSDASYYSSDLHSTDKPRKRLRYSSPGRKYIFITGVIMSHQDSAGDAKAQSNFMHTTPAPSPIYMGPVIDYQMGESPPAPTSSFNAKPPSSKITPAVPPQVDPVNAEWRIPPSWVPADAHVSLIDGKWRAGADKDNALRNEALNLPPPGDPLSVLDSPRTLTKARSRGVICHFLGESRGEDPSSAVFPWMPYLRQNWRRPQWIKDKHPDAVRSRAGTGRVQRRRLRDKPADAVGRPSWDAPIEEWGHYFWSSPKTVRFTNGIRWPKNNNGIKLRQVCGFILVASRAPFGHRSSQAIRGIRLEGLYVSKDKVMRAARVSDTYTDESAANELALQGVTVNEVNDAQPYGFFWLLDNRFHSTMGEGIRAIVDEINKIPKSTVEAVPRLEPQVYPEPSKILISASSKASSSRKSPTPEISDDEDDYRY